MCMHARGESERLYKGCVHACTRENCEGRKKLERKLRRMYASGSGSRSGREKEKEKKMNDDEKEKRILTAAEIEDEELKKKLLAKK